MKRIVLIIILLSLQVITNAQGMWLPALVGERIKDMKQKGFKLSADDIYSVNKACMKDAVLIFGGGCTGEIVSDKGLILTNHHCGRGAIQGHSTLQHDYLTDGFWAKNIKEELPCPGLSVKILRFMEEVPADKDYATVVSECDSKYGSDNYDIEGFFGNSIYYIFVYDVFTDIRLVAAAPSAIGNFGADTDNWMWPRHSGDFSMFRIYADKNNQPADYSETNRPYKPKYHFKISLKGVQEDDFTMVFGFPGYTQEYLPACAVRQIAEIEYPVSVFVRQEKMNIMQQAMERDRAVRINYNSRYSGVENAKKKWEGAILGIKRYNVVKQKLDFEKEFTDKLSTSLQLREKYCNILSDFNNLYNDENRKIARAMMYFNECFYDLLQINLGYKVINTLLRIDSNSPNEQNVSNALSQVNSLYSGRDSLCERQLFERMYQLYTDSCPDFLPDDLPIIYANNGVKNHADFVKTYYEKSVLSDTARFRKYIALWQEALTFPTDKRTEEINKLKSKLNDDIGIDFCFSYNKMYFDKISPQYEKQYYATDNLNNEYQKALREIMPDKIPFPDANFTLRFTYGYVKGFEPRDGVIYKHYTTLEGVIEKDNPEIYDYHVPEKLKELFERKDYGRYADKSDGKIHVCFCATNHTTGGNSGSPVLNANGELIGLNFDRCWEGTMSDIMYNPDIARNISVDIRYVLFLIEKLGNAHNIIKEMEIVNN